MPFVPFEIFFCYIIVLGVHLLKNACVHDYSRDKEPLCIIYDNRALEKSSLHIGSRLSKENDSSSTHNNKSVIFINSFQ